MGLMSGEREVAGILKTWGCFSSSNNSFFCLLPWLSPALHYGATDSARKGPHSSQADGVYPFEHPFRSSSHWLLKPTMSVLGETASSQHDSKCYAFSSLRKPAQSCQIWRVGFQGCAHGVLFQQVLEWRSLWSHLSKISFGNCSYSQPSAIGWVIPCPGHLRMIFPWLLS